INFLTSSNYFRFESEYRYFNTDLVQGDSNLDWLFYKVDYDVPDSLSYYTTNPNISNGFASSYRIPMAGNDHTYKVISGELKQRWNSNNWYVFKIFHFADHWDNTSTGMQNQYFENTKLHILIALKWDTPDSTASYYNDNLLHIDFIGRTKNGYESCLEDVRDLDFESDFPDCYTNDLKISSYNHNHVTDFLNDRSGFHIFSYSIPLSELKARGIIDDSNYLNYIAPIIKWNQHQAIPYVSIDYIEFEDDVHQKMREQPNLLSQWLTLRVNSYTDLSSINSFFGVDEPVMGNFDSCKLINLSPGTSKKLITNICSFGGSNFTKPNGEQISHITVFNELAKPQYNCIDPYSLLDSLNSQPITFNDENSSSFIQKSIDNTCEEYLKTKLLLNDFNQPVPFYAVTQSFGWWNETLHQWYIWIYPTKTMQKCLQYLPLCYGASGIISHAMKHGIPEYVTPLLDPANPDSNYYSLKEANKNIEVYGPIVKNAVWKGVNCLKPGIYSSDFPLGTEHFANIAVVDQVTNDYQGYVQCGFFNNGQDNYYMLVNRRTEKFVSSNPPHPAFAHPYQIPIERYAEFYQTFDPQVVRFYLQSDAEALYGTRPGLFDPATFDLQVPDQDGNLDVTLQAGDASLRQLVSVLPADITSDLTTDRDVCVQNAVRIQDGVNVTISAGRTLNMLKHSRIDIGHNSSLTINGNLNADLASKINVFEGGSLSFQDAICNMSDSTLINVTNSNLLIRHSEFNTNNNHLWNGFLCNESDVSMLSSSISNAMTSVDLKGTSFQMLGSKLIVPQDCIGINVVDEGTTKTILLSSHEEHENVIEGAKGSTKATGFYMNSGKCPLICKSTKFSDLSNGIEYSLSEEKADSVANCQFENCILGINITGANGLSSISNCVFDVPNEGKGVCTHRYVPLVNECFFKGNGSGTSCVGLYMDGATGGLGNSIVNCIFESLDCGIESRESIVRFQSNYFTDNAQGIIVHNLSLIDCSFSALNIFNNRAFNFSFLTDPSITDTMTFCYTLELSKGHNDFYHFGVTRDFCFGQHYRYNGPINATENYWSSDNNAHIFVTGVYIPVVSHWINVGMVDQNPNTTNVVIIPNNRYEQASAFENEGDYSSAYLLYKQILTERLPEEEQFWELCVPSIYKIAYGAKLDFDELIAYYGSEIAVTVDKIELIRLMNAYKANTCLAKKDYQAAADLICERINNPISETDSLEAVMDLEIVYVLRDLDGAKAPMVTNFAQFHYPDLQTFNIKHEENLKKLQDLYDCQNEPDNTMSCSFMLNRNYPNPFNPSTTIEYSVPKSAKVKLRIYNIRGQLVKELVNQ
ncbi:MAG TPA: hypothetical protein PKK33_08640, partial [Candidatus Cloacimonadota bacterium]|nr:hypothetical protein [Candidatus Cloacimonadota bacterium]